jgi:DNA-binding transcriptional MerR regulator
MAGGYRIGEFADLSGVSAKTLRFYDEIGLLRPASVDPRTRYRLYLPQQLEELATILALKDVGVPLAEVRNLTRKPESLRNERETLQELRETLEESIQSAQQSLRWVNAALDDLDGTKRPIPVVVKRRPAVLVASVRSAVNHYSDIERFEKELLGELPVQACGDLRGVLWHRCEDSGGLEGEPFVALKQRVPTRSVYEVKQLPPATFACAYSGLDEESWERAYSAIRKWMSVRGYTLAGPKREVYLDKLLEIQFPFQLA